MRRHERPGRGRPSSVRTASPSAPWMGGNLRPRSILTLEPQPMNPSDRVMRGYQLADVERRIERRAGSWHGPGLVHCSALTSVGGAVHCSRTIAPCKAKNERSRAVLNNERVAAIRGRPARLCARARRAPRSSMASPEDERRQKVLAEYRKVLLAHKETDAKVRKSEHRSRHLRPRPMLPARRLLGTLLTSRRRPFAAQCVTR